MALKFFILALSIAAANAGLALTSTSDNTYRSPGNLAQISTQSKTIETPYSSSSKSDIRVSNPSIYASHPQYVHAAPALQHYSSAPAVQHYAAPAVQHYAPAPAVQHYAPAPAVQHYAAAPAVQHYAAAPAVQHYAAAPSVQHYAPAPAVQHYAAAPAVQHYAPAPAVQHYAAPAPAVQYAHAAPAAQPIYAQSAPVSYSHGGHIAGHQQVLGVAYSPANAVAHLTYNNANDHVNYTW